MPRARTSAPPANKSVDYSALPTEALNPRSELLDTLPAEEVVKLMVEEEAITVKAVRGRAAEIAQAAPSGWRGSPGRPRPGMPRACSTPTDGRCRCRATPCVNRTTRPQTRLNAAARPIFTAAAVVVERDALTGLSTTQLADYALMRALARADPHRLTASSPATILRVLEAPMGSELPVTLTRWDLGFLRGLYASRDNLYATAQRGEIRRGVAAELDGPEN